MVAANERRHNELQMKSSACSSTEMLPTVNTQNASAGFSAKKLIRRFATAIAIPSVLYVGGCVDQAMTPINPESSAVILRGESKAPIPAGYDDYPRPQALHPRLERTYYFSGFGRLHMGHDAMQNDRFSAHPAAVVYNRGGLFYHEQAQKIIDDLRADEDPTKQHHIMLYGISTGGMVATKVGALVMEQAPNVHIDALVLDCSQTSVNDVRGVVNQSFMNTFDRIPAGNVTGLVVQGARQVIAGKNLFDPRVQDGIRAATHDLSKPVIDDQIELTRSFYDQRKLYHDLYQSLGRDTHVYYVSPTNPNVDTFVQTDQALKAWREVFPSIVHVPIATEQHASMHLEPKPYNEAIGSIYLQTNRRLAANG